MEKQSSSEFFCVNKVGILGCNLMTFLISLCRVDESEIDKNERLAKWENYLKDGEEGKQVSSTEQKSTDAPDAEVEVTSN